MALSAGDVASVTVTITGDGIANPVAVALVASGGTWGGTISQIPAGSNRTFTLSARDSAGVEQYHGTATGVTITEGQTTTVVITAQQVTPPPPYNSAAPVIDALIASALTVAPGSPISFAVTAHDPNPGDTLSYTWSAAAGTFSAPSDPSTNWTAPVTAGTVHLTIDVHDQVNAHATMSLDVVVAAGYGQGSAGITVNLNTWPVIANVSATPTRIDAGETTMLDVVATDSDGDALAYLWTSDCNGVFSALNVKSPSFTLSTVPAGNACTLGVSVADGKGGSSTGSVTISTGPAPAVDLPPEVISAYQSADMLGCEGTVVLRVQATDPNGSPVTFAWTASTGTLGTPTTVGGTSEVVWTAPTPFVDDAQIQVTITDGTQQTTARIFSVQAKPAAWQAVSIPGMSPTSVVSGVWSSGCKDVYVASYEPTDIPAGQVFHFDGTAWTSVLSLASQQTGRVFGTSANDVFVVVYACPAGTAAGCGAGSGGRIYRSTDRGATWMPQALPSEIGTSWLGTISGTPNNVQVSVGPTIIRFNGTTWNALPAGSTVYALDILSANEGYYITCWGWGSWDGSTWTYHANGWDFCDVNSIWGVRNGGGPLTLYAAGNNNFSNGVRVWRFDEATQSFGSKYGYVFSDGNIAPSGSANGIWGSGPNDVYVMGGFWVTEPASTAGRLYHYDGATWSRVAAVGTMAAPQAIWGTSSVDVWVGTVNGGLLHLTQ
jgi:hypothetical protein